MKQAFTTTLDCSPETSTKAPKSRCFSQIGVAHTCQDRPSRLHIRRKVVNQTNWSMMSTLLLLSSLINNLQLQTPMMKWSRKSEQERSLKIAWQSKRQLIMSQGCKLRNNRKCLRQNIRQMFATVAIRLLTDTCFWAQAAPRKESWRVIKSNQSS